MLDSIPKHFAPFIVDIRSASCTDTLEASPDDPLASSAANRISSIMLRLLLLAAPSVPMATLTPLSSNVETGQMPLASLRLDFGQCATLLLRISQQRDFAVCQLCCMDCDQVPVDQSELIQALDWTNTVFPN